MTMVGLGPTPQAGVQSHPRSLTPSASNSMSRPSRAPPQPKWMQPRHPFCSVDAKPEPNLCPYIPSVVRSPQMLAVARDKVGAGAVRWVDGSADELGEEEADLVLMTGHVAQFFVREADWRQGLRRIRRVLCPGGLLVHAFVQRTADRIPTVVRPAEGARPVTQLSEARLSSSYFRCPHPPHHPPCGYAETLPARRPLCRLHSPSITQVARARHPRSGDRSARADLASVQRRIGKLDRRAGTRPLFAT